MIFSRFHKKKNDRYWKGCPLGEVLLYISKNYLFSNCVYINILLYYPLNRNFVENKYNIFPFKKLVFIVRNACKFVYIIVFERF